VVVGEAEHLHLNERQNGVCELIDAAGQLLGSVQRVGDLDGDVEQFGERQGPPREPRLQGLPFQQLHGDQGLSLVVPEPVNRAAVGVVERRGAAGLTVEAGQRERVVRQLRGRNWRAARRGS